MDRGTYRDLRLLSEISTDQHGSVTQRSLAKKQGLALGLTNLLIRRMVKKGYIKIVTLQRNRLRYLITPRGFAEKARLTYEYIDYSLYFYRQIRTWLTRTLTDIPLAAGRRVVLYGAGEVAEIASLILRQNGFEIVAAVESTANDGDGRANQAIERLIQLPSTAYDRVVVASLKDSRQLVDAICRLGISPEKVIAVPDEGTPEFHEAGASPVTLVPIGSSSESVES